MKLGELNSVSILNDAIATIPELDVPKIKLKSDYSLHVRAVNVAIKMIKDAMSKPSYRKEYQALMSIGNATTQANVRSCMRDLKDTPLGADPWFQIFLGAIGLTDKHPLTRSQYAGSRSIYMPFIVDVRNMFMLMLRINMIADPKDEIFTVDEFAREVAAAVLKKLGITPTPIVF